MANKPEWIGPKGPNFEIKVDFRLIAVAVLGLLFVVWMVTGGPMYTVAPEEEGVVLTFGRYTRTTQPGLHFKWPWPVQTVELPKVTQVKRIEIGFRSRERSGQLDFIDFSDSQDLLHEAQMLTGDENVVNCSMSVQYRITNAANYLFNFDGERDVTLALRDIAEAALRQGIGDRPIDHALTTRKDVIQNEVLLKMQELVDLYGCGVRILAVQLQDVKPPREVEQSFREVASAREKREEIINQARGYQNERGQASRFSAVAREYAAAPDVTRVRMYLDMMSEVLPRMKVTVIDEEAGILNLRNLGQSTPPAPPRRQQRPASEPGNAQGRN
jgi:membrane protease subunit HflK